MRLLDTATVKLSSFDDDNSIPPYAILSHTWGNAEISFHDLLNYTESRLEESEGYQKIRSCCALAATKGHEYVWIDTCCIDKASSAELSEAINSMFRWYQEAQTCYAYLADVRIDDIMVEEALKKSRWFTRGWTLQELLAPEVVVFYDKNWRELGSKSSLIAQISLATGIQQDYIHNVNGASVAQKMSWASKRQTRRVEDMAYSLMGIFDVNMPLLYGEGKKAFTRLQHEIVKISDDESLFAWRDGGLVESGLFAQSPKAFTKSGNIVQISSTHRHYIHRAPYTVTNRGLAIENLFSGWDRHSPFILDRRFAILPLNCGRQPPLGLDEQLSIRLEKVSRDEFVRFSPGRLDYLLRQIDERSVGLAYIRPGFIPYDARRPRISLFIDTSSLSKCRLSINDSYNCRPETQWCAGSNETLERITIGCGEMFAAILLEGHSRSSEQLFGVMIRAIECSLSISLVVFPSSFEFRNEMDKYQRGRYYHFPADPVPIKLQDGHWVSMALGEEQVEVGRRDYLAEFVPIGEDDILKPKKIRWWMGKQVMGIRQGMTRWYVRS